MKIDHAVIFKRSCYIKENTDCYLSWNRRGKKTYMFLLITRSHTAGTCQENKQGKGGLKRKGCRWKTLFGFASVYSHDDLKHTDAPHI